VKTLVPSPPCRRDNSIVPLASAAQPNLTPTRIVKRAPRKPHTLIQRGTHAQRSTLLGTRPVPTPPLCHRLSRTQEGLSIGFVGTSKTSEPEEREREVLTPTLFVVSLLGEFVLQPALRLGSVRVELGCIDLIHELLQLVGGNVVPHRFVNPAETSSS
jgi:hypothetical protein